jgi:hypothetical protein
VDGHDRVPGGQQAVDDQAAGALDDDRQRGRLAEVSEAVQRRSKVLLGVPERPAVTTAPASSSTVTSWVAQSQPTSIWPPSGVAVWLRRLVEALSPVLHCSALDGAGP